MSDKQEDQTSAEDQEDRRYCVDEDTAVSRFRHGTIHSCGTGKAAGACEGTEGTAGISEEAARSFRRCAPSAAGSVHRSWMINSHPNGRPLRRSGRRRLIYRTTAATSSVWTGAPSQPKSLRPST